MRISDWSSDVCSSDLLLHLRGVALDPAIDRLKVDRNAAFRQHFLKVAIADRIATIPAHRPQDHITLEMAPLEIRHRSVRPISAKHAQASRFLQQSRPAHLLTMAPTRSGKGVGTIIPNLLTIDRSVICIDPKEIGRAHV